MFATDYPALGLRRARPGAAGAAATAGAAAADHARERRALYGLGPVAAPERPVASHVVAHGRRDPARRAQDRRGRGPLDRRLQRRRRVLRAAQPLPAPGRAAVPGRAGRRARLGRARASTTTAAPGEILRCPWHGWEFDMRTGQSWFDPERTRVRRYEVEVVDAAGRPIRRARAWCRARTPRRPCPSRSRGSWWCSRSAAERRRNAHVLLSVRYRAIMAKVSDDTGGLWPGRPGTLGGRHARRAASPVPTRLAEPTRPPNVRSSRKAACGSTRPRTSVRRARRKQPSPSKGSPRRSRPSSRALAPGGPINTPMRHLELGAILRGLLRPREPGQRAVHAKARDLAHAVYGYFQKGGTTCWIVRVGADAVARSAPSALPVAWDRGVEAFRAVALPGIDGAVTVSVSEGNGRGR